MQKFIFISPKFYTVPICAFHKFQHILKYSTKNILKHIILFLKLIPL